MPRIRTIKPEFWTSEQVVECSTNARLLFIGMWNHCDDAGVHPASVKRVKMEVFPSDPFTDSDVSGWIEELVAAGLLGRFEADGKAYWFVTGWHHQKIDRPSYKFPRPPSENSAAGNSPTERRPLAEHSSNTRRAVGDDSSDATPRNGPVPVREGMGVNLKPSLPPKVTEAGHRPRTGSWEGFDAKDLKDPAKIISYAQRRGIDTSVHENRLRTLAAALCASAGDRPAGLFVSLITKGVGRDWSTINDDFLKGGKDWLRNFEASKLTAPAPAPSESTDFGSLVDSVVNGRAAT